ncbi:MAG: immune inhibitor A domain-containing protein [Candidatus Krumholzibacteriota bacterium]
MTALCVCVIGADSGAEIARPRSGEPFPPEIKELIESQKPFLMNRRWLKSRAADRYKYASSAAAGMELPGSGALTGTLYVPSITLLYENTAYPPVRTSLLQRELFDGPWETGTMAEYFNEVSRGLFGVSGRVAGWFRLAEDEAYYSGGFGNWGLDLESSRTGELIAEAVMLADPGIDFGLYDNDGPDQVPNSGDDDGYVDILFLITPTMGAECDFFSSHFWSHSGSYASLWSETGESIVTSDPAAGGGYIRIDDYIIAPSISCYPFGSAGRQGRVPAHSASELDTLIEIGLFCHELAHALGLPDLYDTDVSKGIGYWGLMGFGELNTPESPAHMSAYSKHKLGWADLIEVGLQERAVRLGPVISSGKIVKMNVPRQRFRRALCPGSGYALVCGLSPEEGAARGWPDGGGGYGNMWNEGVGREFVTDGSTSCLVSFEVSSDTDTGDYGCLILERGNLSDTLACYSGFLDGQREQIELGGYLGSYQGSFSLIFRFISGYAGSDEDGDYDSGWCYSFRIDNLSVEGGGIDYHSDFEEDSGGWKYLTAASEYFLAEYRTRSGFDSYLPGEGLLIWHVDDPVARSVSGNTGGCCNELVRGVVLEEADGRFDILSGSMGEAGDPFPGATGNTSFAGETSPASISNCGRETPVFVKNIDLGYSFSGPYAEGLFRGGRTDSVISVILPPILSYADAYSGDYFVGINWNITGPGPYRSLIYRKKAGGGFMLLSPDTIRSATGSFSYRDLSMEPGEEYSYRLSVFNGSGRADAAIAGSYGITSEKLRFIRNYPNPFSSETRLVFYLPESETAELIFFDAGGRKVASVAPKRYGRGYNSVVFRPSPENLSSGVYFCMLKSAGASDVIKIVLLK